MDKDHVPDEVELLRSEVRRLREQVRVLTPSLPAMLRRRGFLVHRTGVPGDLLVPPTQFHDSFYTHLHKYSFRLLLRDIIKFQDWFTADQLTRYASARIVRSYLGYLQEVRLVREASLKFDSKIRGTAWVDEVRLAPVR